MWLMLRQDQPDDYVVATGRSVTIRDMVAMAFACAGLDWREHVTIRQDLMRPAEVDVLLGDATKARERLGWAPSVTLEAMLAEMVEADLARHRARQRG
jgi:GDPmannose 4,6-dehydratase